MEAGRLAAEYLVSHGLLPPNVLSSKWQNGSSFKRILRQEAEGQEGRPSALARLGNANSNADASPSTRRRFVADEFPSLPFKTPFRGRRRPGYNRAYASDWAGKDFSRSVSFQDRFSDADEDTFSDHQGTRNGADYMPQKSFSNVDLASKSSPPDSQPTELDNPTSSAWNDSSEITQEPQKTSDDLRTDKVKDCASSNSIDEIDKKEENVVKDLDFPKALEGESTSNNTSDLLTSLTMCKFAKVPTRIRSSLTSKSQKLDPTEASVTSSHSKIQVLVDDGSPLGQSVGELGRVYNLRDSRCERSLSLPPDRAFVSDDERELSQGPLQYSSADKDNERGEKRALEDGDMQEGAKRPRDWLPSVVVEAGGCFNLSNSSEKNVSSHEDGASYGDGANVDVDNENLMVSNSQFSKDGGERHIDFSQEKRLFPSSFKICDLNLMEASETHENHNGDPIMIYPALSEIKREAAPVDVDLSINNSNVSGEKSKRPGDGKEIEVIDLENDSAQEDKDLVLVEVKK